MQGSIFSVNNLKRPKFVSFIFSQYSKLYIPKTTTLDKVANIVEQFTDDTTTEEGFRLIAGHLQCSQLEVEMDLQNPRIHEEVYGILQVRKQMRKTAEMLGGALERVQKLVS